MREQFVHLIGRILLRFPVDVFVNVLREPDVRVPDDFRDDLQRNARSLCMSQIKNTTGALAALAVGYLMASILFGLKSTDLSIIALAASVLSAVALAPAYIPALHASRVDPAAALQFE